MSGPDQVDFPRRTPPRATAGASGRRGVAATRPVIIGGGTASLVGCGTKVRAARGDPPRHRAARGGRRHRRGRGDGARSRGCPATSSVRSVPIVSQARRRPVGGGGGLDDDAVVLPCAHAFPRALPPTPVRPRVRDGRAARRRPWPARVPLSSRRRAKRSRSAAGLSSRLINLKQHSNTN